MARSGRFAIVQQPGYNGANPIITNTCVTADCGNCSNPDWQVPLAGTYQLSKFELFEKNQYAIAGVRLSFTDGVNTIVSSQIGGYVNLATEAPTETHNIVQCVTGVTVKQVGPYSTGTKQKISAFILHFADSTTLTIGTVAAADPAYYSATELGLLGFKGQLHQSPHGQTVTFGYSTGWIPYTDTCSSYSSLIDRTIQNMTVAVFGTATQDASFRFGGSLCCGPRIYTLTPQPTYVTLTTVGSITTLTVNPTSYSNEGSVSLTLTVQMQDFPAPTITKTFTVTVTCAVTSITFDASIPASKILNVGIDSQPLSIPFSITKTAACTAAPVFTLTPSLGFVSFSSTGNSGTIVVNGATILNQGTYTLTLTATQTISQSKNISLDIRDPCKTAVIVTIPATLSAMTVIVPAAGTDVQTYTITTDVTQAYPAITCDLDAVLSPASAYIQLSPNDETITINKSAIVLPTDLGATHSFSIAITSVNYPATVLAKTLSFNVAISCTVSSFTAISQPADATYYLYDGATISLPLSLTQVNNCQLPFTYTSTYKKNGGTISKPAWLTWNSVTKTYSYDITAPADMGVYEISTTATTSQLSQVYKFTLTVVHDCLKTILTGSVNDMAINVGQTPDSQTLSFPDSIATSHSNPIYCGSRVYTLSPTYSFLTIVGGVLTLSTSIVADSGTYNPVTLQVSLQGYPSIVLTKTFTATISCNVYSLTWASTMPTTVTIQVGITPQPFTIPYSLIKLPACPQQASATYGPSLSFLSQTPSGDTGNLQVNGALQSDQNTYSITLTGVLDGVVSKFYFDIQIIDPCKTAAIQSTPASLSTMQVIMPTSSLSLQTYSVTTDVQVAYPSIVCNMIVILSPSTAFISLSTDYLTITVDPTKITLPTQIGVHPFSLLIQTTDYGATGQQKTLNFNVEIVCTVTNFIVTKPVQIFYTIIFSGPVASAPFTWLQQSACQQPETFSVTYQKNSISLLSKPSFITYDSFTKSFMIDSSLKSDVGLYAITMTATVPQLDPGTGSNFAQSETFYINVRSDCIRSEIIDRSVRDMAAVIGSTLDSQDLYFDDTISQAHGDRTYCPQSYTLIPHMSFLDLVGSKLTMQPTNPDDEGTYEVSLKVWYQDFPEIEPISKTFKVVVQCEILSWKIVKPLPIKVVQYTILVDRELIVDYGLVAVPACKSVLIELTPPMPFQTLLDVSASKITISSSNLQHSGTYPLQLSGKPKPPNVGAKSEQNFKMQLINLCNQALFDSQQLQDVEVFVQSQKYTEIQLIQFDEFEYFPKTKYPDYDCGEIQYELISAETKTWVQLSGKSIVIDFKHAKKTNVSNQVTLHMSLKQYPAIQHEEYFNVTLSDASIQCISQPPVSLKLGSEEFAFGVSYTMRTFDSLTPVFESYIAKNGAQRDSINGLSFNAGSKVFKFKSIDPDSLGTFEVGINFYYTQFSEYQVKCTMPVKITYTVAFDGKDPKSQTILPGKKWIYKLPEYTDFFGYPAMIALELGAAVDIFSFDPTTKTLVPKVDPDEFINFIGSYEITMTLFDRVGGSETKMFTISIIDLTGNAQGESKVSFMPPPKPFIEKTTQFGQIRIGFTRSIVLPTFARYPIFNQEEYFSKNCTNGGFCDLPKSRVLTNIDNSTSDEMADESAFSLSFNREEERQAIEIVNRGLTKVNGTFEPVVKISVIPGSQSNYTMLSFLWNCTKMTNTYMDVDVFYDHVMEVSAFNDDKEKIKVSFYGRKYFPAEDGQTFLLEDSFPQKLLPTQMDPKRARKLTLLASLLSGCGKLLVVINFVKNLIVGGALSEMFASIKKMQIMIHLAMTNVNFPANAQIFMSGLFSFVTYNLIDLEGTMRRITGIEDTEQISPNAYFLGYHSVYLLVLISNVLVAILSILGSLTFFFVAKFTKNERIMKYREELKKKLFWNGVLSLNLEMHLILCICVSIQFKNLKFTDKAKGFSSVLNFIFLVYIFGSMAISAYIVQKYKSRLNTKSIKEQFSSLYEDLNIKRTQSTWVLQEPLVSNLRAALLAFVLLFADNYPYFQIFYTNMSVTFMVIYIQWFNVYADPSLRFWNTINEVFIMLINYHVICFSRLIEDKEATKTMGWSMIVTMVLCIVLNFTNIAYHSGSDMYTKFKTLYYTKKRDALIAKQKILVESAKNPQISPRLQYLRDEKGVDISQILFKQKWNKKHRPGLEEIKNEIRGYEHIEIVKGEVFVEARIRRNSLTQNQFAGDKQPGNENLEAEIKPVQIEQLKTYAKRNYTGDFELSQDSLAAISALMLNDQPEGTKEDQTLQALNQGNEQTEKAKIDADNQKRLLEEVARAWDSHPVPEQQKSQLIIQDSFAISSLCEDLDEFYAQLHQQYGPTLPVKETKENVIAEGKNNLVKQKRMVVPVQSSSIENETVEQSKKFVRQNSIKLSMPNTIETRYVLQRQKLKQLAFEPKNQATIDKELQDKEFWQKYDEAMREIDKENQRT